MRAAFRSAVFLLLAFGLMAAAPEARAQARKITVSSGLELLLKHNLQLRQQRLQADIARADQRQSRLNYAPDVSLNWGFNRNFGTSFDPFSFQRVDQTTDFSSPSLRANWVLFAGFANHYTRRQAEYNVGAATEATARVSNQLITQYLAAWLQLMFDRGNLAQAQARFELLESQVETTRAQYEAGVVTEADFRNLEAQMGLEKVAVLDAQNAVARDELSLTLLLQLDPGADLEYLTPEAIPDTYLVEPLPPVDDVERYALRNMPEVKEAEQRLKAAQEAIRLSKSAFYPTLSAFGSIGSNYTSNGGQPVYDVTFIDFNGVQIPVERELVRLERDGYFEQLEDNFNSTIGVTLSLPLFSRGQRIRGLQVARLSQQQATLSLQTARNELRRTVRQAHFDAVAARQRYLALQNQVKAAEDAFALTETQYNLGQRSFIEYREALNTLTTSQNQLAQARYDYLFKRKILEYYAGQELQLDRYD